MGEVRALGRLAVVALIAVGLAACGPNASPTDTPFPSTPAPAATDPSAASPTPDYTSVLAATQQLVGASTSTFRAHATVRLVLVATQVDYDFSWLVAGGDVRLDTLATVGPASVRFGYVVKSGRTYVSDGKTWQEVVSRKGEATGGPRVIAEPEKYAFVAEDAGLLRFRNTEPLAYAVEDSDPSAVFTSVDMQMTDVTLMVTTAGVPVSLDALLAGTARMTDGTLQPVSGKAHYEFTDVGAKLTVEAPK